MQVWSKNVSHCAATPRLTSMKTVCHTAADRVHAETFSCQVPSKHPFSNATLQLASIETCYNLILCNGLQLLICSCTVTTTATTTTTTTTTTTFTTSTTTMTSTTTTSNITPSSIQHCSLPRLKLAHASCYNLLLADS